MARMVSLALVAAAAGATMAFVGPAIRSEPKVTQHRVSLRASAPDADAHESQSPLRVSGAMLSIVAALALVLMPVEAQAAKSGGRIGGTAAAARSKPPPRAAPKAPAASSTNKTTVINQTTVVAPPPVVAAPPMGMGMGMGYGPGGRGGKGKGRGNLPVKVITREVPKIEVKQVEKIVEIPNIEYQDRLVEVREVREVVRRVPRIEVREIPIERVIQVPKKVVQEVEQPVYRPVPHMVKQHVEREIPVPKTYLQTLEVVKQVSVPTTEDGVVIPQSEVTPQAAVQPGQTSPPAQGGSPGQPVLSAPVSRTYELPPVPSGGTPVAPGTAMYGSGVVQSQTQVAGGDLFSKMDTDGSGALSREEFAQAQQMGMAPSMSAANPYATMAGPGVPVTASPTGPPQSVSLGSMALGAGFGSAPPQVAGGDLFSKMDKDGSGGISREEFAQAQQMGVSQSMSGANPYATMSSPGAAGPLYGPPQSVSMGSMVMGAGFGSAPLQGCAVAYGGAATPPQAPSSASCIQSQRYPGPVGVVPSMGAMNPYATMSGAPGGAVAYASMPPQAPCGSGCFTQTQRYASAGPAASGDLFSRMDRDGSGVISREEFEQALRSGLVGAPESGSSQVATT
mmetsp:Transcript_56659/g.89730  ORF Transcript_56659/g.89730 Transcript_56659/m.89730 type:complete len:622 (-) Transcript_56659:79-1944(-)